MANTAYRELQKKNPSAYPIFHQGWWLDIACGGEERWRGIVSTQAYKGSRALMPVPVLPKWRVIPTVRRPLLTPYLGPWHADLPNLTDQAQFQLARRLWPELITQLPSVPYFHQTFRPEAVHALPFYQAGFRLRCRYSYRLATPEIRFNRNNRRALARADSLQIWQSPDTAILYHLLRSSLRRQELGVPFSTQLMERLHQAAAQHNQSEVWVAGSDSSTPHAAIWVLRDAFCIYVLSNGLSPAGRQSGAYPKLIARLLEQAAVAGLPIDLCGTMIPSVATINVGLGAQGQLCLDIEHGSAMAHWLIN